jgi:hypothetical protein
VPDTEYGDNLLDNFEVPDGAIPTLEGRKGGWYAFGDNPSGNQQFAIETIPGTRGSLSLNAAHVTGSGYTSWGSGIGIDLNGSKTPYDASAYVGITFWARSASPSATGSSLMVLFPDANSVPSLNKCQDIPTVGASPNNCDKNLATSVQLTPSWKKYTVNFADLVADGGTQYVDALAADELVSVQFRMPANAIYDYWIDDIVFIPAPTP